MLIIRGIDDLAINWDLGLHLSSLLPRMQQDWLHQAAGIHRPSFLVLITQSVWSEETPS
jgi:hypothetical protein